MTYETMGPPAPPGMDDPNMVTITFDPHVQAACILICIALFVLAIGWMIDYIIAEFKKNNGPPKR